MPEKLIYTWEDYNIAVNHIVHHLEQYSTEGYDDIHLVSIYRGSLPLGVHLSNILGAPLSIVKFQTRDNSDKEVKWILNDNISVHQKIIVLDDIFDTGFTMNKVREFIYQELPNARVHGVCLHQNGHIKQATPEWVTSFGDSLGQWVEFPWEVQR